VYGSLRLYLYPHLQVPLGSGVVEDIYLWPGREPIVPICIGTGNCYSPNCFGESKIKKGKKKVLKPVFDEEL
jgi:hypothetical protein